jgi:ATP-dependent DNA helicase RecQ
MAEPSLDLDAGLKRLGYDSFRPGQREAIETLLAVGRLLLVAPTGGGKSLIYQLPAELLPGTALVVSPLVALMHDQVAALEARGVAATFLAATLPADEMRRRMARLAAGAFKLAYVAPERMAYPGFRGLLRSLQIPLLAVDEAHCISEWGHDFRPDYLEIGGLIEELRPPRVLACTATATPVVRDEILARLGLPADTPQHVRGFARPNLALRVAEVRAERERAGHVDAVLAEALGSPGAGRGTAIVYSPTRRASEAEAERLRLSGWNADAYHAGMTGPAREEVQRDFAAGALEVVVATNAFGMGIDRPDVRAVVHLAPPGSIEAYYQEVGRAGRDGAPAIGLVLISPGDMALRRRLLEDGAGEAGREIVEHKWGLFLELMRWAEGGSCRHDAILRYFGDEAETLAGCGRCDVCEALDEGGPDPEAVTLIVRKSLSAVARVHRRFGLTAAVKLLRGEEDPRLVRAGLVKTPTFGALREHDEDWLLKLLRRCVTAGWVDFTTGERPLVYLTEDGRAVMRAERPARLVLPQAASSRSPATRPGRDRRREGAAPTLDLLDDAAAAIFEALRRHRLALARGQGVPPYVVASDRALREIAILRPRTLAELRGAHGIGDVKAERYGAGFLDVVARVLSSSSGAAS